MCIELMDNTNHKYKDRLLNVWLMQSEILSIEMDERILVKKRYQLHIYIFSLMVKLQ